MDIIRSIISWVFMYICYPAFIVGIFVYIMSMLIVIFESSTSDFGLARRIIGASIPFVSIIFLFATSRETINEIDRLLNFMSLGERLSIGALSGILMIESSNLFKTENDIFGALLALVVSIFGAFLMLAFIGGILNSINDILLTFVISSGLYFIFRGSENFWMGDN